MATIELKNIKKSFGANKVIDKFNIKINHGEFIVLVGPSGCGKSTLLRMISGLETVDEGEIHLDKKIINNLDPQGTKVKVLNEGINPEYSCNNSKFVEEFGKFFSGL